MSLRWKSRSFSENEEDNEKNTGQKGEIMRKHEWLLVVFIALTLGLLHLMNAAPATAASATEIERGVNSALKSLYTKYPAAKVLAKDAKGILVFPEIVKGGFIVGGLYGEGALRKDSGTVAYYSTVAASYGLQAGLQKYGYVLIFMTDSALRYLDKSGGWEIGIGPNIVVIDAGTAKSLSTTTAKADIYAFFFSQKGLMAGLGLQGTKITKIKK
jgi:lipid-binding SYLF domain-containing protein